MRLRDCWKKSLNSGYGVSTLEVLIALVLVVLVLLFTGRVVAATLTLIGRGNNDDQRAARARTVGAEWIRSVSEYTRRLGFGPVADGIANVCTNVLPCVFTIRPAPGGADAPYSAGPALPRGFSCGRVTVAEWQGEDPARLLQVNIAIYRQGTDCADVGTLDPPFLVGQTGLAVRSR